MADVAHSPAAQSTARYGILGGTFDPPHLAHLVLAQEAMAHFALDRVYFVPTGQSPHKLGRAISAPADRCAMVARAIADNPGFALSTVEVDRPGPSYTAQTLRQLRAEWGPHALMYLILGWDMLLDLPNWYDLVDVVRQVSGLAVMHRPGYDDHPEQLAQVTAELPDLAAKLMWVPAPRLEISATDVRRRVATGQPIRYLVPDNVAHYIAAHGLYGSDGHGERSVHTARPGTATASGEATERDEARDATSEAQP